MYFPTTYGSVYIPYFLDKDCIINLRS